AAEIAAAKHPAVIVSSELAAFLNGKIQVILGVPVSGCPASGPANELLLPLSQPCTGNIGYGSKRTIRNAGAAKGVQIALVAALPCSCGFGRKPFEERTPKLKSCAPEFRRVSDTLRPSTVSLKRGSTECQVPR